MPRPRPAGLNRPLVAAFSRSYVLLWFYRVRWLCWYPLQRRLPWCMLTLGEGLFAAALLAIAGRFAALYLYDNAATGRRGRLRRATGLAACSWPGRPRGAWPCRPHTLRVARPARKPPEEGAAPWRHRACHTASEPAAPPPPHRQARERLHGAGLDLCDPQQRVGVPGGPAF
jgi:hypothetical protein